MLPGAGLLLGLWLILGQPTQLGSLTFANGIDANFWVAYAAISYAIGHGVTSFGENMTTWGMLRIAPILRRISLVKLFVPPAVQNEEATYLEIYNSDVFVSFVKKRGDEIKPISPDRPVVRYVRNYRNVAMTLADAHRDTVLRLTFLSLLNLGIATDIILVGVIWLTLEILRQLQVPVGVMRMQWWILPVLLLCAILFIERYYRLNASALRLPFSMANAQLGQIEPAQESVGIRAKDNPRPEAIGHYPIRVYLSGGFKSGWQDQILGQFPSLLFRDPRVHDLKDETRYTTWDLEAIQRSDWVLAYIEASNPGGYALAAEVGYAKALGKRIFFVEELAENDQERSRYFGMVRACADITFQSLDEAIAYISELVKAVQIK
jgi:hypothetical protein